MTAQFETSEDFGIAMDARDPLAEYRQRFHLPITKDGKRCLYLCGHSLGLQPKTVSEYVKQELTAWAQLGVEAHFHGQHPWMPYHRLVREQTASLLGAKPDEVVVMNSLTANLHLMMVSFYRPSPARHRIVIEANAFPSDGAARSRTAGVGPARRHHGASWQLLAVDRVRELRRRR